MWLKVQAFKALLLFDWQISVNDSKHLTAIIVRLKESKQTWGIGLLYPEDEGGTILRKVDN
jgi:hypothetical protein